VWKTAEKGLTEGRWERANEYRIGNIYWVFQWILGDFTTIYGVNSNGFFQI
jgi:hypothetical protein